MRITLTLADYMAERLAELGRDRGLPFDVVANQTLRRGLGELAQPPAPFSYIPHAGELLPGIDNRRLNELAL